MWLFLHPRIYGTWKIEYIEMNKLNKEFHCYGTQKFIVANTTVHNYIISIDSPIQIMISQLTHFSLWSTVMLSCYTPTMHTLGLLGNLSPWYSPTTVSYRFLLGFLCSEYDATSLGELIPDALRQQVILPSRLRMTKKATQCIHLNCLKLMLY